MKFTHRWLRIGAAVIGSVTLALSGAPALADHATPGEAGSTKVAIYDNTNNGWNVATNDPVTGGPDAEIGTVNFRPTVPGDPNRIQVVVALKNGAPNCDYNVELVTSGSDPDSGLAPDSNHFGFPNVIGTITTNGQGKGNTGAIDVDVTGLFGAAASGDFTYAHVDLEDSDGNCTEADGTSVTFNEYGASAVDPGDRIHWLQP